MGKIKTTLLHIWTVLWKSVLFFVIWGILLAPFLIAFSNNLEGMGSVYGVPVRLYFELITMLTILCAAWIMVSFIDKRAFATIGFMRNHLVRELLVGLGIGAGWLMLSIAVSLIFKSAVFDSSGSIIWPSLLVSGTAMLLNTVTQEVLARSYIFQTIQSETSAVWAIILTSILFVLFHAAALHGSWLPAINIFFAGILFSTAYYITNNLWMPISIHFIWNFLLGPVFGLAVSGQNLANNWKLFTLEGPSLLTGGSFGIEGSLIVTIITVLFIAGLLVWHNKFNSSEGEIGNDEAGTGDELINQNI